MTKISRDNHVFVFVIRMRGGCVYLQVAWVARGRRPKCHTQMSKARGL